MNLLSLILMISILESEFKEGENQIINGFEALQWDFNYHVFIMVKTNICTGGIIDTNHVITAAHCVNKWMENDILIIAGVVNLRSNASVLRMVQKINIPDDYYYNPRGDDIAVLKLCTPLVFGENIGAISLPFAPEPDNEPICWFTGLDKNEPRLHEWKLSWIPLKRICNSLCECMARSQLPPRAFCAIDVRESSSLTYGDSGGVLVCDGVAVGIFTSRVENRTFTPNVFCSIYDHLDFIRTAIKLTAD